MRLTWTRTRIIGAITAVLLVAGTGAVWALTRSDSSHPVRDLPDGARTELGRLRRVRQREE
jgi:hypothetical protein